MRARLRTAIVVTSAVACAACAACRKAERTDSAAASAAGSASASTPVAASAAASASASTPVAATWALPPRPTEPVLLGGEASFLSGKRTAEALDDVRLRNGGALELLDLHIYPARIVLKAKEPKSDAIQRWEVRTTGVIGPKLEGLSAKKLEGRLFDVALLPLGGLEATARDAVTKSGLADGSATLVDVRRAKDGKLTMRIAVHSSTATKWVDVDVTKK